MIWIVALCILLCIITIFVVRVCINNAEYTVQEYRQSKEEYNQLCLKIRNGLDTLKILQEDNEELSLRNQIATNNLNNTKLLIDAKQEQYNQMELAEQATRDKLIQEREIWFENYKKDQEEELKKAASEFIEGFNAQAAVKINIGAEIAAEIDQLRKTAAAAIEIAKHKEEEKNLLDYYRLTLSPGALADMAKLREIMPELNQPEILGKLIWKVYLEKPYSDLCGRLFGDATRVTGIYKITNLNNEMCYVGQAVNVIDRWKQHIKRAIGAETPIQNKLYPAMSKEGIENFTFELIEEVSDRLKLDEREDYWQDFYKAKEFGYSIK